MKVLVIDIGGTTVKFLTRGQPSPHWFHSGPTMTPQKVVKEVKKRCADVEYDVVSVGYPGVVKKGKVTHEPRNLARGWVGFNFRRAFGKPVRVMNDAAMQALGSYRGGLMFFLGMGTGLGSALIANGVVIPMEMGNLAYKRGTYEDYVGLRGFKRLGRGRWWEHVLDLAERVMDAVHPDELVLGGGNSKHAPKLPPGCRLGSNGNAFLGGFKLWDKSIQPA
jgi:polyphosphate glucokinase